MQKCTAGRISFFLRLGVGFDKTLIQEGAECFFNLMNNCVFGAVKGEWPYDIERFISSILHACKQFIEKESHVLPGTPIR